MVSTTPVFLQDRNAYEKLAVNHEPTHDYGDEQKRQYQRIFVSIIENTWSKNAITIVQFV
jgi:hypothetical protein